MITQYATLAHSSRLHLRYTYKQMSDFYRDLLNRYADLEDQQLVQIALNDCRPIRQRQAAYAELAARVFPQGFNSYPEVCAFIGFARELQGSIPMDREEFQRTIAQDIQTAEDIAREFEREYARYIADYSWSAPWSWSA